MFTPGKRPKRNASNRGNDQMDMIYTNTVDEIHVHVLGRQ